VNIQRILKIFLLIVISQSLYALKNPKTEFEVAVRHFNSDRVAICEKILTKRKLTEWGEYSSAVLLLKIKCAYAQKDIEKTRKTIQEFFSIFPDSRYTKDVLQTSGDLFIDKGFYSKALEYYLKARKSLTHEPKLKLDNRILKTISIGIPIQDIGAIRLLETDPMNLDILNIASAITYLILNEKIQAEYCINQIDPLNLFESYFDIYEDILKSVSSAKSSLNKIAVILPLTGEYEAKGNRFMRGLQTGFFTHSQLDYSLLIFDNESSIYGTIKSVKEISSFFPVSAIVGPLSPQFSVGGVSTSFTDNNYHFLPYSIPETITDITTNTFQMEPDLQLKGKLSAKYMTEVLGLDSIAVVAPSTPEGRQCVDAFLEELDRREITPVLVEWYSPGSRDLKRPLSSLREIAWKLVPEDNEFEEFLGMNIDSLNALFSIDTDDFFEEEEEESLLKTKRDSSKVQLATIEGLYIPLSHEDLSFIGTQLPMYNLKTQIVGHDGWLDLETMNKENIGPHFQNLILLTSSQFNPLNYSDIEQFNRGDTEYVDGYDTALFLTDFLSTDDRISNKILETHSHLYFFPKNKRTNQALYILSYRNNQFNSLGHFLSDSLISYIPQTP
tara:strand:+ start:2540 stop:4378 length:1839 start_codon:yes stop_codon:yes gene_type:complete